MKPEKKSFKISLYTLAVLLLLGCAQDESLPGGKVDDRPATLQLSALQAADVAGAVSRAVTTSAYPTDKFIGFFVKADAAKGYKERNNSKGIYDAARKAWIPTPDSIWMNKNNADVAVYAPYDAAQTTAGQLKLTSCIRPADGSKDIWCKRFAANKSNAHYPVLTLAHVYTRLVVSITRNSDYTASATLTNIALSGSGIFAGATFTVFADAPYTNGTAGFTAALTAQTINASTPTAVIDMLLIPATLSANPVVTLTVDGKEMKVTLPKDKFAGSKLEAGKQYNVSIKLKPHELQLGDVSVVNWGVLPDVNGGNAEFDGMGIQVAEADINLTGNGCTAQDKKDLAKLRWADGNLRSTGSADYAWASTQQDYGYYYPWHSTYEYDDYTEINNIDPCSKLNAGTYGTGWRTPSSNELEKLSRCTDKVLATYNGVKGMWFMNKTKGLFLPAAGRRPYSGSGTTATDRAGEEGYYWSCDTYNSNDGSDLYFSGYYVGSSNSVKRHGCSVRCVKGIRQ